MTKRKIKKSVQKATPAKIVAHNKGLLKILGISLAIIAFLIYANTLKNQYALDDASAITANYVTQQGISGIPTIFTKHYRFGYWASPGTLYRPVPLAMFAIEWQISPDNPALYHFINVLFYAFTAFMMFWVLCKIMPKYSPILPFLATLIFITHPVHVEVIANIKSRDEILSFFFCLLAVYYLWKYFLKKEIKWLAVALLSYLIAMFSKENAITFLAVFPLLIYFFRKVSLKDNIMISGLFAVPAGIYLAIRFSILKEGKELAPLLDNFLSGEPDYFARLASTTMMTGKYLWTLVFPHPLGSDFGYNEIPLTDWGDWKVLLTLGIIAGAVYYTLKNFKKKDIIAFGILYFAITFSIFSNIILLIGSSFGDRFMYFPSLGFALIAGDLILKIFNTDFRIKSESLATFFKKSSIPDFTYRCDRHSI